MPVMFTRIAATVPLLLPSTTTSRVCSGTDPISRGLLPASVAVVFQFVSKEASRVSTAELVPTDDMDCSPRV